MKISSKGRREGASRAHLNNEKAKRLRRRQHPVSSKGIVGNKRHQRCYCLNVFLNHPPTPFRLCVCVCVCLGEGGRGGGCFTTNLDQVVNSIGCILQVSLKFSVQGIHSIIKQTVKYFIWLQLITYEFIHFQAGTSSFKDCLLVLSPGRNK